MELEGPDTDAGQQNDERYDENNSEQFHRIHFNHFLNLLIEFENPCDGFSSVFELKLYYARRIEDWVSRLPARGAG